MGMCGGTPLVGVVAESANHDVIDPVPVHVLCDWGIESFLGGLHRVEHEYAHIYT